MLGQEEIIKRMGQFAKSCLSIFAWIVLWAIASHSHFFSSELLPPPEIVIQKMFNSDFLSTYTFSSVPRTFFWVLSAWILGLVFAAIVSALAIISRWISAWVEVLFIAGRSLPSVIAIPLFATIMGIERSTVAICTAFLVVCYSEPSFQESFHAIRRARNALKEALNLSLKQEIMFVILPGAAHAWKAIAVQSFGIALVVTVAGEMILSFTHTVGWDVSQMAWLLKMVDMYAIVGWLIVWAFLIKRTTDALPLLLETPGRFLVRSCGIKLIKKAQ
jgi:ABC-type nitrate/sulfonate/bicarbonate transport system permease component